MKIPNQTDFLCRNMKIITGETDGVWITLAAIPETGKKECQ